ncbi:hypothetical protein P4220_00075 [Pseudomonas aeruginosa]|nr:hypothetical protein [Pseudomonas aeruginosa]
MAYWTGLLGGEQPVIELPSITRGSRCAAIVERNWTWSWSHTWPLP